MYIYIYIYIYHHTNWDILGSYPEIAPIFQPLLAAPQRARREASRRARLAAPSQRKLEKRWHLGCRIYSHVYSIYVIKPICTYTHTHICIYHYNCIYNVNINNRYIYTCIHIYIFIYIYIERERVCVCKAIVSTRVSTGGSSLGLAASKFAKLI